MFVSKLFVFIFFLLFGEVSENNLDPEPDTTCQDWYLSFPTKSLCLDYYKHHQTTSTETRSVITTPSTTTTTSTTTTSTTTTTTTSWTLPDFETTVSPPPFTAVTKISTTFSTTETMVTTSTTQSVTNSATNKTPWFLSLWAIVFYR